MNDLSNRVNTLIATVSELVALMDQESTYLRAMRAREIGKLQERKTHLAAAYESSAKALKSDREALETVDPILRQELSDVLERLGQVVQENEAALRAVTKANERLMNAIVQSVRAQKSQQSGYTAIGATAGGQRAAPVSLQIDQTF